MIVSKAGIEAHARQRRQSILRRNLSTLRRRWRGKCFGPCPPGRWRCDASGSLAGQDRSPTRRHSSQRDSLSPPSLFSSPLPFPLSALVDSSTCPPHSFVHSLPFPPTLHLLRTTFPITSKTSTHTHTPHLMPITMHTPTPNGLSQHCPPPLPSSRSYTSKQITNLSS